MDTNIKRYDHTTATDYMYGSTTQEYMALMESTFMWVYPEPMYGDTGSIVGSEWYAVHSFSSDLVQVSNLLQDICIGSDEEVYPGEEELYPTAYFAAAWNSGHSF
jgi:hypothetical protein